MQGSKSSSTYRNNISRRSRSEDHVCSIHQTRSEEKTNSRRQEREKEHEIQKQKMI